MTSPDWPALPFREWEATCDTLHMWTQIVGKTRMVLTPPQNHWWHVPLYVTPRVLTTSSIPLEGESFDNYVEWIRITYALTLTALPILCLPCGVTEDGLPVGLQLVGRPRGEMSLLQAGAALEDLFDLAGRLPIDPRHP